MSAFAVSPPVRARPRMWRIWLPLMLSLAVHALLSLGAVLASRSGVTLTDGPVRIEVVTVDPGCGTIVDDEPMRPQSSVPPADDLLTEPQPSHVSEAPVQSPVPSPVSAGPPTVDGNTSSSGAAGKTEGSGGAGILSAPGTARRIVYVIDRSVSMGTSGALRVAKSELLTALAALPDDARFAVVLYERTPEVLCVGGSTDLVAATPANRAEVARLLETVLASGSTDHVAALRQALALGPEVIFFVTDADDLNAEQVRQVVLFNRQRAAIHAVELNNHGQPREETPLQLLAHLSGGSHRVVPLRK